MTQNTNAAANIRLEPNKSNNIGRIVEEHVRYWRQYKDKEEAEELARKAREQEYNFKVNNKALELYEGIKPGDNKGFLNSQIIALYEKKKPEILELSRAIANGDSSAVLKYNTIKENFARLTKVNEVYGKKGEELSKNEDNYNELLDKPIKDFRESTNKGLYAVNDDFTISVMVNGKEQPVVIDSSTLFNNEYLQSTYSGRPKFNEYGKKIAENFLDNYDGNQILNEKSKNRGILQVRGILEADDVELRSTMGHYIQQLEEKKRNEQELSDAGILKESDKLTPFEEDFLNKQPKASELSSVQKTKLSEHYFNSFVLPNVQQVIKPQKVTTITRETNKLTEGDEKTVGAKRYVVVNGRWVEKKEKTYVLNPGVNADGTLEETTNMYGKKSAVFGGFEPFEITLKAKNKNDSDTELEIEQVILSDVGSLTYRDANGNEGKDPEVIKKIATHFKLDNVKSLYDELKESRKVTLEQLKGTKTASKKENKSREIKSSDIPSKAAASGYSVSEYTKLLEQNGVTIIK